MYHCNARSPPVGEHMFRACCRYDLASNEPLSDVLPRRLSMNIAVGLLLGEEEESWLKAEEAVAMAESMAELGFMVETDVVRGAGHQLFTDDVDQFNERAAAMIESLLRRSERREAKDRTS